MLTSHEILLVSPTTPVVKELGPALKPLDMVVTSATSYASGRLVAERVPGLALVVIDAHTSFEQASELLRLLKDKNRRLPVLWVGAAPSGPYAPEGRRGPGVKLSELSELAQLLMFDDLYPPSLVRALVSACNMVLASSFDCAVEFAEPRLSRSAVRPGNLTALMTFGDGSTAAHCILSGEERSLFGLAASLGEVPGEGPRQLALDLASELVNQIVGRLKATCELFSGVRLALPYVITGEQLCVHAPSPKPSLAVQIDINSALLTVDLWFRTSQNVSAGPREPEAGQVDLF